MEYQEQDDSSWFPCLEQPRRQELATKTQKATVVAHQHRKVDGAYLEDGQLYSVGKWSWQRIESGFISHNATVHLNFVVLEMTKPSKETLLVVSNTVSICGWESRVLSSIMIASQPISWQLKKPWSGLTAARVMWLQVVWTVANWCRALLDSEDEGKYSISLPEHCQTGSR